MTSLNETLFVSIDAGFAEPKIAFDPFVCKDQLSIIDKISRLNGGKDLVSEDGIVDVIFWTEDDDDVRCGVDNRGTVYSLPLQFPVNILKKYNEGDLVNFTIPTEVMKVGTKDNGNSVGDRGLMVITLQFKQGDGEKFQHALTNACRKLK